MEKRRHDRRATTFEAELRAGDDVYVGEVLDVSQEGLFFRPASGMISGYFTHIFEYINAIGRDVWVQLRLRESGRTVTGQVCWEGPSALHRCSGIGLRLLDISGPHLSR